MSAATTSNAPLSRVPLQPLQLNSLPAPSALNRKLSSGSHNSQYQHQPLPSIKTLTASLINKHDTETTTHARRLKYRLKLAYYKLRTDQVNVPLSEIMNKNDTHLQSAGQVGTTPSLTRHISLLAASTPFTQKKKRVAFMRSVSMNDSYVHRVSGSLQIKDLVNGDSSVTPVKRTLVDDHGDLIMSSPTKKMCSSTPGSYGAAKSLLQLSSLISSN